jgi:TraB/PrgY/gumN family
LFGGTDRKPTRKTNNVTQDTTPLDAGETTISRVKGIHVSPLLSHCLRSLLRFKMTRMLHWICVAIFPFQHRGGLAFAPVVTHLRVASVLTARITRGSEPEGTVVELVNSETGQQVTLVGTAHLSQQSNDQVKYIIDKVKPDVVMIELDPSRLERIGLTEDDLGKNFGVANGIVPPLLQDDVEAMNNRPWWSGVTDACLTMVAEYARGVLTNMYRDMGKTMGKDGLIGGGEFLAAINAAKCNDELSGATTKIVLGDRNSIVTIKRAVELAIRSGDPFGALERLASANQEEIDCIQEKIREELEEKGSDLSELNVAVVEALKNDMDFRNRIFDRLGREVPEFTRAFVTERDYIMAEVIKRETEAKHVVAVVGLAHVSGVTTILQRSQFQDREVS